MKLECGGRDVVKVAMGAKTKAMSSPFASTARDCHCMIFQIASTARVSDMQALHCKRL